MDAAGKKRLLLSTIIGAIGGGVLIFINFCKFREGVTYGDLILLTYVAVIIVVLSIQQFIGDKQSYIKKIGWGLISFYVANIIFTITEALFTSFTQGKTMIDYITLFLFVSGIGLVVTLLVAAILLLFQKKSVARREH